MCLCGRERGEVGVGYRKVRKVSAAAVMVDNCLCRESYCIQITEKKSEQLRCGVRKSCNWIISAEEWKHPCNCLTDRQYRCMVLQESSI